MKNAEWIEIHGDEERWLGKDFKKKKIAGEVKQMKRNNGKENTGLSEK